MKDSGRKNRRDSENSAEVPDFHFDYSDSDTLEVELAEWYTYSEEPEFLWNLNSFKNLLNKNYPNKKWKDLNQKEKKSHILRLIEYTDVDHKQARDDACRSILYLCQGTFDEVENLQEYHANLVENVSLLYQCDIFNVFMELFIFEINNISENVLADSKYAPSIADNVDVRVILSVLYTILEVVRLYESEVDARRLSASDHYAQNYQHIKHQLKSELNKPILKIDQLLSVYLFQLINKFCNQNVVFLPIKKIILFLWKVLLFTLGGLDEAFRLKNEYRKLFNLAEIAENPKEIMSQMTPATPPPNPVDIANEIQLNNPNSSYKRKKNINDPNNYVNGLTKQTRGIDSDDLSLTSGINNSNGKLTQFGISTNNFATNSNETNESETGETDLDRKESQTNESESESNSETNRRPSSPPPLPSESQTKILEAANDAISIKINFNYQPKSLPWQPKVRISELESFLDQERKKFLGFGDLSNDLNTLVGLPNPIHESIRILRQHLYTSLSDEQIKLEENFLKYPLSTKEVIENASEFPAEVLFSSLLNNLPQYLICLLKILLTSIPQIRPKADSLQIMSDLFPEELSGSHYLTIKLGIDSNRHKVILIFLYFKDLF
ncbi:striatin-interacting 2 [Brachionus plicatilis]|uniref:Striatin-interacting 2 n=1 Tax=Brachionus plicatilis TaxID=10195 RepID=A0A3M7SID9_BRAPC|nr:striatin-interacting 2 [Brachionus plicatilis]